MLNNGGFKAALVVVAVVGMLVGAIGLTSGLMNERDNSATQALAVNASKKVQYAIDEQQAVESRVTVLETNYVHIFAALRRIEAKLATE